VLGPPVSDDAPTPGGRGAFVRFQHGDVYWSPATGSQLVRGDILAAWLAAGGATGGLGFPTTSDAPTPGGGGYFVRFERGDVYWSQATGARTVLGSIRDTWLATGGSGGYLGFPTTSDTPVPGKGAYVRFQGGDVYWSPTTGTQIVRGEILNAWLATGGATGYLGFPTTSDAATADGRGYFVRFQGGDVYWSAATGTQVVRGSILSTWLAAGGATGPLGFPTTSDAKTADGRGYVVRFTGGDVYWSPATGSQVVSGAMAKTYWQRGGSSSALGFPTRSSYAVSGGMRTDFEHGSMTWNATSGAVAVSQ
jgi:uncharacterized protein with LGFP repeats